MKKKILGHVAGISAMLLGTNFVHMAHNTPYNLSFFGLKIPSIVVFDTGLALMGLGFFIEFCQSFKPLEVK